MEWLNELRKDIITKRKLDQQSLRNLLVEFVLVYQCLPAKGMLDHERKRILINPAFIHLQPEIVMHELLHYLFPSATEWFVRERTREIVHNDIGLWYFLERYCVLYAEESDMKCGLAGSIGIRRLYEPKGVP